MLKHTFQLQSEKFNRVKSLTRPHLCNTIHVHVCKFHTAWIKVSIDTLIALMPWPTLRTFFNPGSLKLDENVQGSIAFMTAHLCVNKC